MGERISNKPNCALCGKRIHGGCECSQFNYSDRIAELEAQVANFQSDAYVLSLLTKIDELEAKLNKLDG